MPNQVLEFRRPTSSNPSTERNTSPAQQAGTDVLNNASVSSGTSRDDLRRDLRPTHSNERVQNTNPSVSAREEARTSPHNRGIERDQGVAGSGHQTIEISNRAAAGAERHATARNESPLNSTNTSPISRGIQRDQDLFRSIQDSPGHQAIRADNRAFQEGQISTENGSRSALGNRGIERDRAVNEASIEAVKKIRKFNTEVPIVMLTVFDDNTHVFEALQAGASGYLLKKHISTKLFDAIQEVLDGGAPMSPSIARMVLASMLQKPAVENPYQLTSREKEILTSLSKGNSYKMIASEFGISIDTVRTHIKKIYEKLHVHSQTEAVSKAINEKLV